MRDSLLRLLDDLETRREAAIKVEQETNFKGTREAIAQNFFASGSIAGIDYVIKEIGKVLEDHGKSE